MQHRMDDNEKEFVEKCRTLLGTLDKALKEGPWEKGLLFKTFGNKLKKHRDRLKVMLNSDEKVDPNKPVPNLANRVAAREGMIEVSVALYCSDGSKMSRWESVLHTLSATIVSRPIYKKESDVVTMIRSKPKRVNEGYCLIYIDEKNIAKPFTGKNPEDKMGHELLVLKQGAIDAKNIVAFVHQTGVYNWSEGKLIKRTDDSESKIS